MNNKFKVGDLVKIQKPIKDDLIDEYLSVIDLEFIITHNERGRQYWFKEMDEYDGYIGRIKYIFDRASYEMESNECDWYFHEDWLTLVEEGNYGKETKTVYP
jgi:hypothetical protein